MARSRSFSLSLSDTYTESWKSTNKLLRIFSYLLFAGNRLKMEENILVRHGMDYFLANRKSLLNIFLKYLGMLTPPSTMWS